MVEEAPAPHPAARRSPPRSTRRPAAPSARCDYRGAGTVEFLRRRRQSLLLHGDQRPHPGRASGHRGGDRHRSDPRADRDCGDRRAAVQAAGGDDVADTPSSAGSTPRIRTATSCHSPARGTAALAGRSGRALGLASLSRLHGAHLLRLARRQADRAWQPPATRRGSRADARSANSTRIRSRPLRRSCAADGRARISRTAPTPSRSCPALLPAEESDDEEDV